MAALATWALARRAMRPGPRWLPFAHVHCSAVVGAGAPAAMPPRAAAHAPDAVPDLGPFVVSPAAVRRMQALRAKYPDGLALRVTVDSGGCSGFKYKLTLDTAPPGGEDVVVDTPAGVRVVTDAVSLGLVKGATIDYVEEMARTAFVVASNPQAATGCSCGSSFTAKE
jgi:iron-sulfur cluster assembly accessory protein